MIGARPPSDRDRLLAWCVGERITERDQIEEVIGMQMADQNGADVDVVPEAAKLREDPVAAVQQQREILILDQVAAACAPGI